MIGHSKFSMLPVAIYNITVIEPTRRNIVINFIGWNNPGLSKCQFIIIGMWLLYCGCYCLLSKVVERASWCVSLFYQKTVRVCLLAAFNCMSRTVSLQLYHLFSSTTYRPTLQIPPAPLFYYFPSPPSFTISPLPFFHNLPSPPLSFIIFPHPPPSSVTISPPPTHNSQNFLPQQYLLFQNVTNIGCTSRCIQHIVYKSMRKTKMLQYILIRHAS